MKKRDRPHIEVETLKNGYSLKVDGDDYMYFDPRSLLEGFVYHVGLHKRGTGERDKIANIVKAMETWPDASQVMLEAVDTKLTAVSLRSKNEHLTTRVKTMMKTIERLEKELADVKADRTQMQQKMEQVLSDTNDMISEAQAKPKRKSRKVVVMDVDEPTDNKHAGGRPKGITPQEVETRRTIDHDSDRRTKRREAMRQHAEALLRASQIEYSEAVYKLLTTPLMSIGISGNIIAHIAVDPTMRTVGDVVGHPRQYFVSHRGCGKGTIDTFEKFLHDNGLAFGMDVEKILLEHARRHHTDNQ